MTVRPTESRFPPSMQASDFGQAVSDDFASPAYFLISYLSRTIPKNSFNEYVVFAVDGSPADAYEWTFTYVATGEVLKNERTGDGIQILRAEIVGKNPR